VLDDPVIEHLFSHLPADQRQERAERLCNYFAACLLMPRPWLKHDWCSGIQRLRALTRRYYVSEEAMTTRLSELGLTPMTLALERKQRHIGAR
jgi:Zn-dependent peptidase ImmA (M78 family)